MNAVQTISRAVVLSSFDQSSLVLSHVSFKMHPEQRESSSKDDGWNDPIEVTSKEKKRAFQRILSGASPKICSQTCDLLLRLFAWQCWSCCCPPCPPCIMNKMTFGYHVKSTYALVPSKKGEYELRLSKDAKLIVRYVCGKNPAALEFIRENFIPRLHCFYVSYGSGHRLACIHYRQHPEPCPVILFSKRRCQDIGIGIVEAAAIAQKLSLNVFVYDYSGYGCSDGRLSEKHLYGNIERVYEYMTETLGIPWQQIVALGMSLGTVATIHLASKYPVGAVILEGSFMSGLRTAWPEMKKTSVCCDRLVSIDKIHKVKCPTLFVHGSKDDMFPLEHMVRLRDRCPGAANIEPLIVLGAGHESFGNRPEYWARLVTFLEESKVLNGKRVMPSIDTMPSSPPFEDAAANTQGNSGSST